jgi:hypothetical protein
MLVSANPTICQGQGNSHGKGHNKHDDDDEQSERYYKQHDEREARDGITLMNVISHLDSPKKINYPRVWKSNS